MAEFLSLDLPPLLTAFFSALSCALRGNYLILKETSLMGDAIAHAVLPGIVIAFLITSSRAGIVVFLGAAVAGALSAMIIELIRRYGRVESGASMGVVFSIFFALGIILIEQAAARNIDLDADCLLHGQLESIFWYPPATLTLRSLLLLPAEVYTTLFTLLFVIAFIAVFYKELKITSFDPALATALGFRSSLVHQLLMILVACAVVASFKAVGSILVIAMIICPGAAARICTDRLKTQLLLSSVFASIAVITGYFLGAFGPQLVNYPHSVSAAGMMAVMSGLLLILTVFFAPNYGLVLKATRRALLALSVREEDILALMYRINEQETKPRIDRDDLLLSSRGDYLTTLALRNLLKDKELSASDDTGLTLTQSGKKRAKKLVRSHRLWESYLTAKLGLPADHVHPTAEQLEHIETSSLEKALCSDGDMPTKDPHGSNIPDSE